MDDMVASFVSECRTPHAFPFLQILTNSCTHGPYCMLTTRNPDSRTLPQAPTQDYRPRSTFTEIRTCSTVPPPKP